MKILRLCFLVSCLIVSCCVMIGMFTPIAVMLSAPNTTENLIGVGLLGTYPLIIGLMAYITTFIMKGICK